MPRGWRPIVAGAVVVVAVFLLAQRPIFEPSSEEAKVLGGADPGAALFGDSCAGCHGRGGTGGTGPVLVDSGLEREEIVAAIEQGPGIMPPGLVTGQNREDVVEYVLSISG